MRSICVAVVVLVLSVGARDSMSQPAATTPSLSGPVSGGKGQPFGALSAQDLAASRYTEAEYFVSGTSQSFEKAGAWGLDGKWAVIPAARAEYKVRMLVRRPSDPRRFNGVLIVEWLNVTAMSEGAADYMQMKEEIERSGYAWAGIGAQAAGVNAPRSGLKASDPERYATLVHPGDAYSYDIFTQATQALQKPSGVNPLGDLRVRHTIATGRSQSAFRLVTYINAFHLRTGVFNGFFVHSRGANAAGLTAEQLGRDPDPIPPNAHLRTDTGVPVFDLQTEGDMVTLRSHLTGQPDSQHYRLWEIAGAAHAESAQWVPGIAPVPDLGVRCVAPINSATHHAVVKAGLDALTRWVRDGKAPRSSPAIVIGDAGAPPGTTSGQNFCFLFGHTKSLEAAELTTLYPTHTAFVKKFDAAVDAIARAGYWLKPEGDLARAAARQAPIGR